MTKACWDDNSIQFPRLIAEIKAVGLSPKQVKDLCSSMDISKEELHELLDRGEEMFENMKKAPRPIPETPVYARLLTIETEYLQERGWVPLARNGLILWRDFENRDHSINRLFRQEDAVAEQKRREPE